ncbi:MAG: lysostaphin resistance A-like protein [Coprobacillaceae bacterium]
MNNDRILAGELTNKQKALGYIILFPSYLYYIPKLAVFFLLWYNNSIHPIDGNVITVYLNVAIGLFSLILGVAFFKDFLMDNIRAFKKTLLEDTIWSCSIGIGMVYGLAILSNIIVMVLLAMFNQQQADSSNQQLVELLLNNAPLLMTFQAVVLAPIVEELLYRGLIFRTIYSYNKNMAHILSAFLFGFSHIYSGLFSGDLTQIIHIIPYMMMGFAFSYAYEKRGNICAPIIMHMLNNLIATLLSFLL